MRYLTYSIVESDIQVFISFWSKKYQYIHERLYEENIDKPLNKKRVKVLYFWKNGCKIAEPKERSIKNNYIPSLLTLPVLNNIEQGKQYFASLKGGVIWNIFWLHCLKSNMFPIFDQHTYRACTYLLGNGIADISELTPRKIKDFYFDTYIPFFNQFGYSADRRVDKALFTFGKFLKKWNLE